jgi:hypothetical protein
MRRLASTPPFCLFRRVPVRWCSHLAQSNCEENVLPATFGHDGAKVLPRLWHKRPLRRGICVKWISDARCGSILDLATDEVFSVFYKSLRMTELDDLHHSLHVFQKVEFDSDRSRIDPRKIIAVNVTAPGGMTLPPGPMVAEGEKIHRGGEEAVSHSLASSRVLATPNATVREDFIRPSEDPLG